MYQTIGTLEERDSILEELVSPDSRAEDSGYTEDDMGLIKKRKDACCSPVQAIFLRNATNTNCCCKSAHQIASKASTSGNSKGAECTGNSGCVRRHTFGGTKREFGSNSSKSALSGPAAYDDHRAMSSDSEDNADKLFVPNLQRSNSSSAYDGEPEQSD